jgi:uncharacterized protein
MKMEARNSDFQIFVKPVGPACNLNCSYCYYLGKKKMFKESGSAVMKTGLLEKYIREHISASSGKYINFSWHGGEPLLAGKEFFRKVVEIQKKFKPQDSVIMNGLQTNGTLLDDEWCRFLSEEGFNVGISLDGPGILHDKNRCSKEGSGTFKDVIRGFDLLQMYGITAEILCVVSSFNVDHPAEVYNLFRKLGARYIAFLPLVEPDRLASNGVSVNTVNPLKFGYFLSRIFDEWVENDIGKIKVQIFEEAARSAFGQEHTLCIFKTECGGVPVLEHNGDFFQCDHYVDEDHRTGNITTNSVASLLNCEIQKKFGKAKLTGLPEFCVECEVRQMCNGECPKNRIAFTPTGEPGLNYLCEGYKYFFSHCRTFVEAVAAEWRKNN